MKNSKKKKFWRSTRTFRRLPASCFSFAFYSFGSSTVLVAGVRRRYNRETRRRINFLLWKFSSGSAQISSL
ncbi:hypothetical protein J5N97_021808 [Dioscorea zingiberensis]|uniref:Uncharacterized protein n=1 Tax=Dioscorea zingiberensis TaxID=325984 RepID=A0A9D5C985_9LILI|nr:hypothetical protein J5N97_021808 [Dioscorea zingiberensis]